MPPLMDPSHDHASPQAGERFGDVAIELNLLTPEQVAALLAKQKSYRDLGIPMRIDEIAVDMGILARVDSNIILKELRNRRRLTQPPPPPQAGPPRTRPEDEDLVIPCRLGDFEVEQRLGGVMGAVYRAYDRKAKRKIALKLLPRSLSSDRQLVARFQNEAVAAGKLSHPNVVAYYGAGEVEGRYYISMEYVDGEALMDRLEREGRFPEREALHLVRELAHALYHAHVNKLLHRDVKPDNVIIDRNGRVRLTDLGLAKILSEDKHLTESGIAIGTPHYISPEQARGDKVIDHRSDLYGLGATLFHLVCGRPPFDGNAAEVMRKHVYDPPPDPHSLAPELSMPARNLILKLMHKNPAQRVQNADALIEAIDAILKTATGKDAAAPSPPPSPPIPVPRRPLPSRADMATPTAPKPAVRAKDEDLPGLE